MRMLIPLLALLALAACAPRASVEVVRAAPDMGRVVPVFVGTTRAEEAPGRFSRTGRGPMRFARYDVSVPPERAPGSITLAGRNGADPRVDFVTRAAVPMDAAAFRADLGRRMQAADTREMALFIHGFNSVLGDGLFRIAQMKVDVGLPGIGAHYAWPSAGNPLGYVRDRDSVLYGRDGLIDLMDEMAAAGAQRIVVIAHSMGALLLMESLIWAEQRASHPGIDRIAAVALLSPDIDVEVFRAQARALDSLPEPFFIFASDRDAALRLSARLTGETDRLGSLTDVARVAEFDVRVIDVSNLEDAASSHQAAVTSPTMLEILKDAREVGAAFAEDAGTRLGIVPGTVLSVRYATQVIVEPMAALARAGR